jgi:wyosine [tRNA(Phe)-imidazoG37] synthetase (radical SAM superfamily)
VREIPRSARKIPAVPDVTRKNTPEIAETHGHAFCSRAGMLTQYLVSDPQTSRRFGRALRLDLIGGQSTVCSYSCAYCRSKSREDRPDDGWPDPAALIGALRSVLERDVALDHIVIAGNGEPTQHPAFGPIVDDVLLARDQLAPATRVAILSNGSQLHRFEVRHALARADVRLMKLDAGDATTFREISGAALSLGRLIGQLRQLGDVTLLSRFVRNAAQSIDNTSRPAVDAWLQTVATVRPLAVQVCGRDWASQRALVDVPRSELEEIADRVKSLGIPAVVF